MDVTKGYWEWSSSSGETGARAVAERGGLDGATGELRGGPKLTASSTPGCGLRACERMRSKRRKRRCGRWPRSRVTAQGAMAEAALLQKRRTYGRSRAERLRGCVECLLEPGLARWAGGRGCSRCCGLLGQWGLGTLLGRVRNVREECRPRIGRRGRASTT